MLLHVWGNGSQVALFDPECLAAVYFVSRLHLDQVTILPDSNYQGSFNGKLPFLVTDDGKQIPGYKSIVRYLQSERSNQFDQLDQSDRLELVNSGFIEFLLEKFTVITEYNLFLNKDNYVEYTRPLFKQLAPFPLQYKPPMDLRADATRRCENYGITADDSFNEENSEEMEKLKAQERELRETPILNDIQKNHVTKNLNLLAAKKSILTNMKCLTMLDEIMVEYTQLESQLHANTTSMILFFCFLKSNTLSELPSSFVLHYLTENHPELMDKSEQVFEKFDDHVANGTLSLASVFKHVTSVYI
ncbi:hypothetical protein FOA43_004477 [Brettanomyces nanus]|uniref:Mitochondrial outer membrane transport complex Sam37/metaxin N-terminal domain-containing protein n=1 Tax=Eeniella nana TaxID=13502 RepID=A0A875S815_EENNA|nr:uncharacterized protein FOA43_004477 [Brettanomyces nanus]QPG77078.1 hypothetical protein FOA43_004477 [Brettanomyces nanus]